MSDQESEIQGLDIDVTSLNIHIDGDFLLNGQATPDSNGISGTFEKNINGNGKLSLNWRSSQGGGLSAGQVVTVRNGDNEYEYFLEENYVPSPNGDGTYTWSPTFVDSDSKMKGVIVYNNVTIFHRAVYGQNESSSKSVKIYTWPYTGPVPELINYLNRIASEAGFGGDGDDLITLGQKFNNEETIVTVSFDQDNLVSACEKIASSLGTQSTIEMGHICIGTHDNVLAVSEHFDRFIILGGTRNMGKWSVDGDETYAAITMRLTLPDGDVPGEGSFPDSAVTLDSGGNLVSCPSPNGHMTKVLIFDHIYPEMVLAIKDVRERICYLYDENGQIMYTEDGGERIPRTYSKFYITLQLNTQSEESEEEDTQYHFDVRTVIEGRTLGIVFQDGVLCGREFDLSYYDDGESEDQTGRYTDETNVDEDVEGDYETFDGETHTYNGEWKTYDGEFRICMVADGDTLLPNHRLAPHPGDHVTLTGVVLDTIYEAEAKRRLLEEALPYVRLYMSTKETELNVQVASNENEYVVDFLTGEAIDVSPGQACDINGNTDVQDGEYIVTSVTTDIKTGKQSVRYGTFEPQGRVASMANQLETASLSDSGALIGQGEDDYIRHTAAMGLDQFKTLYEIYGHLGMKTVNKRVDDNAGIIAQLQETMRDVEEQADKKFDIWFVEGTPQPYYDETTQTIIGTANFPASDWGTNEEKETHLQDICYDKTRPADGTGGMTWRWEKVGNVYCWKLVSDNDTIAALTQLTDLSRDNILTPSEKLALKREWSSMKDDLLNLVDQSEENEIDASEYICAYYSLWQYLNNSEGTAESDEHMYIQNAYKELTGATGSVSDAIDFLDDYLDANPTDTQISVIVGKLRTGTAANIAEATEGLKNYMLRTTPPVMLTSGGNGFIDNQMYNNLLTEYKTTKTSLMTALSEKSLEKLDDMASDNVLTDIEKLTIIREYERMVEETVELIARAAEAGLDNDANSVQYEYRDAYSALYAYLNDLTTVAYTVFSDDLSSQVNPAMLYNGADTAITGSTFTGLWAEYYEKAAALRQAIQSKGVKVFATSGTTTPTPPYRAGDIWVYTDSSGKSVIRICVNGKGANESYAASDWAENSIYSDPRGILAQLGDLVFTALCKTSTTSVSVNLANTTSISGVVGAEPLLAILHAMLGDITFTISWGNSAPSGSAAPYSLHCERVLFQLYDTSLIGGCKIRMYNENGAWEIIQHSTSALIDNLGDMINLVVFGDSQNAGSIDSYVEGSGITTAQNFIRMFSEAQVWNGGSSPVSVAEAMFGLSVDIKYVNTNNPSDEKTPAEYDALTPTQKANYKMVYDSTAKLSADKILFTGKTIDLNAGQIGWNGQNINVGASQSLTFTCGGSNSGGTDTRGSIVFSGGKIDFHSASQINLNAAEINLNADKINWKPDQQTGYNGTIITGNVINEQGQQTQATEVKFEVSDNGDITMRNAYIHGTLYAKAGKIGGTLSDNNGWTIVANQISNGTIGSNDSMFLSTTNLAGTVAGHAAATSQYEGWRFTVGSKFGVTNNGTLYANNAVLNGDFTTAGGKIQLAETQKTGYKWYGMAYVSNSDALAIGMRDYNYDNNGSYGGHIAMKGDGVDSYGLAVGGIFDVLVGGNSTKSLLRMGSSIQHIGVDIDGAGKTIKIGDYAMANDGTLSGSEYVKMFTTTVGSTTTGHIDATGSLTIGMNASNQKRSVISDTEVAFPAIFISVAANTTVNLPKPPKQGQLIIVKGYGNGARLNPSAYGVMNGSDNASALNSDGYFYVEDQTILLCFDYYTGNGGAWHQIYSA